MYVPPESIVTIVFEFFKSFVTFSLSFLVLLLFKVSFYSMCVLPGLLLFTALFPSLWKPALLGSLVTVVGLYIVRKAWKGFDL